MENKKGAGVVTGLILGIVGLVIAVIVGFVIVDTISGAGLLTANGASDNATDLLVGNLTAGVNQVSLKIPTILLIGAVVLLFGVIVILVRQSGAMGFGGSSGSI